MNIVAQCCSIVIMFVIIYFYYVAKKLPLDTAKAFMGIWTITLIALVLDIFSLITIAYEKYLPVLLVTAICKLYLVSLVWEALLALRYICADIFTQKNNGIWERRIIIYGIVSMVVIFALDLYTKILADGSAYTYGPAVFMTYIFTVCVLCVILLMILRYKSKINIRRWEAVRIWLVIWVVAAWIQFFFNELLLVGFASVMGILVMFLKLENPQMSLDQETGLFNVNGLNLYLKQMQGKNQDVSIICVIYDNNHNGVMSYELEKMVNHQIINFFESIPNSIVFGISDYDFVLVFNEKTEAEMALAMIDKRFNMPWGADHMRMITEECFFLESTCNVKQAGDILPIFQYARQNWSSNGNERGVRIDYDMIREMYEERKMEMTIVEALNGNRVEVFYQPIYSVKTKTFASAEALVRIRDEKGEIVPPGLFIEVAEKRGLIIRLGECVFEQVCKFIVENNPEQYGISYIEVNLSVVQCAYEHLATDFIEIMKRYQVDPKFIVLEITESASIKQKQILLENMRKLREVGVKFALDDFGTGQSNLNYIVEMPVDVVKFDSTMTNAYFENGTAKYVMDAAMHMIQGMDLEIVSEGIEEKEQYRTMKNLGIDYIQGFYFSKPIQSDEFLAFIKKKKEEQQ